MEVWKMFDRIAHRYDLLNRLLSMRRDVAWRRKMTSFVPKGENLRLLDLATGTADQLIMLAKRCPQISGGLGVDMSEKMLEFGRPKLVAEGLNTRFELRRANASRLEGIEGPFDVATMSFGIRNVLDVPQTLRTIQQILKPGGRLLILEFSLPKNRILRNLYTFYFRKILPRIGGAISGDNYAYRYLNETAETFPYGQAFCDLMTGAGFTAVKCHPLTLGVATIYQGDRPSA